MLGIAARDLVRASGANENRLMKWLEGREEIPPHIDLLFLIMLEVPESSRVVDGWIHEYCHDRR